MNIELPLKCPLPAGGRSGDTLMAKGEGWWVKADPRCYQASIPGYCNCQHTDQVSSDARTNLQRGFERLRSYKPPTKAAP
jgi:hypothetical protein